MTVRLAAQAHALYRFYGQDGTLLYVGMTMDPGRRWKEHAADKSWWHEVADITVEQFATRDEVLEAERWAIIRGRPKYNVAHNRPYEMSRVLDAVVTCFSWLVVSIGSAVWFYWFAGLATCVSALVGASGSSLVPTLLAVIVTLLVVLIGTPWTTMPTLIALGVAGVYAGHPSLGEGGAPTFAKVLLAVGAVVFAAFRNMGAMEGPRVPAHLWRGLLARRRKRPVRCGQSDAR